ncbi:unnamed protein product, partial [Bubo scandiacus]
RMPKMPMGEEMNGHSHAPSQLPREERQQQLRDGAERRGRKCLDYRASLVGTVAAAMRGSWESPRGPQGAQRQHLPWVHPVAGLWQRMPKMPMGEDMNGRSHAPSQLPREKRQQQLRDGAERRGSWWNRRAWNCLDYRASMVGTVAAAMRGSWESPRGPQRAQRSPQPALGVCQQSPARLSSGQGLAGQPRHRSSSGRDTRAGGTVSTGTGRVLGSPPWGSPGCRGAGGSLPVACPALPCGCSFSSPAGIAALPHALARRRRPSLFRRALKALRRAFCC